MFRYNNGNVSGNVTGNDSPPLLQTMRRKPKSITIQSVAKAAGVSVSTVSRVLNGKDDVSLETGEKVRQVVGRLGYVSSLAARGMRSHRTNVIGLVMPNVSLSYCHEVMTGVNQAIAQLDKNLLIYTGGGMNDKDHECAYVTLLNSGIADGVIVVTPSATTFTMHAPLVIIDPNNASPAYPAVFSSNREGAMEAMKYLLSLGHRRIGHITGRLDLFSANERLQGYKDSLAAAGIPYDPELVAIGDYTPEIGEKCAYDLLTLPHPPTAIFAANDASALGVYHTAEMLGLRIPQDLSVVGFDNIHESAFMIPPLTTVDQFLVDMGVIATEMIVKLINGEELPSQSHIIQTQLRIRASCQSPKEGRVS